MFSVIERKGNDDQFAYCEPKDALIYIRSKDDDRLNTQFTKEEFIPVWNNFTSALEKYRVFIETLFEKDFQLNNHSESITLFHYINNRINDITEEHYDRLIQFSQACKKYRKESKKYEKDLENTKDKDIKEIENTQKLFKVLEEDVGKDVIKWVGSFQNNGSGSTNLLKRKDILDNVFNN